MNDGLGGRAAYRGVLVTVTVGAGETAGAWEGDGKIVVVRVGAGPPD